jgi:hypothetical protein
MACRPRGEFPFECVDQRGRDLQIQFGFLTSRLGAQPRVFGSLMGRLGKAVLAVGMSVEREEHQNRGQCRDRTGSVRPSPIARPC